MPKLDTNTVIANDVLLNSDGHPCVFVNDEIHSLFKWCASAYALFER